MDMEKMGVWSFYAGLAIAVVATILSPSGIAPVSALVLGVLGIVVGLLNVVDKEVQLFLLATMAFVVGASALSAILGAIPGVGIFVPSLLQAVVIFVAPGAAVVALKALMDITKSK